MSSLNKALWLELEIPATAGPMDTPGGPPESQPGSAGDPMGRDGPPLPPQGGPSPVPDPDVSNDPAYPEMPEQKEEPDFVSWKAEYFKDSVKGDPNVCLEQIMKIRNKDLGEDQRKFVEDNYQICLLRQHQDILVPSGKIRKLVKQQLDMNTPGMTLVEHITTTLEETPLLNEVYIKLKGCGGGKSDYHRKFVGSLLGAVQVGNGKRNEDLVYEEHDYSIEISTRFATEWGNLYIGPWSLQESDPKKYLKPAEMERLEGGSPEERDVLRRRVVMESIASFYMKRAFLVNVVGEDGTIDHLGLDLGNCLRAAYTDGRLVVRSDDTDTRDAFIDEEGQIIPVPALRIMYVKASDVPDDEGKGDTEELEFMNHRNGELRLTAPADLVKEVASVLQGVIYKQSPWTGNPSDLVAVTRSVPSVPEMLLARRY